MAFYWTFRLDAVARRRLYPPRLYETRSFLEVCSVIRASHNGAARKQSRNLPL